MAYQPAQWLRNLARIPAAPQWPWRHSLRLVLLTTIPMIIGSLTGYVSQGMIMSLGGMLTGVSVQTDPYPARLRRIFISAPIGMSGYIIGALLGGHGIFTILGVTAVALFSGLISTYGAAVSVGALQMLTMTIVASHAPSSGPIWIMPVCFLAGGIYAALLLTIESLISPLRPEREMLAKLLKALAKLAQEYSKPHPDEAAIDMAMRNVTNAQSTAYSTLMKEQMKTDGRSIAGDSNATTLSITDRITALLFAQKANAQVMHEATAQLENLAVALQKQSKARINSLQQDSPNELLYNIQRLTTILSSASKPEHTVFLSQLFSFGISSEPLSFATIKNKLVIGQEATNSILRLGICMFIAMSAEYFVPGNRSYWVPLSVGIILKSDFGSVFVRAVQRSVGTFLGVLLATFTFFLVPKGPELILAIAIFSALLPWAALKSYAFQCIFLTPLVLVLIDAIIPGPNVNYGAQRLTDTLIGAGIALIFGYLIWPKSINKSFRKNYSNTMTILSAYLNAVMEQVTSADTKNDKAFEETTRLRYSAYKNLSDLRIHLQRSLSEPPPASTEAVAWLPAISAAERICDQISAFALLCEDKQQIANTKAAQYITDMLADLAANKSETDQHKNKDLTDLISDKNADNVSILANMYHNIVNINDIYLNKTG